MDKAQQKSKNENSEDNIPLSRTLALKIEHMLDMTVI